MAKNGTYRFCHTYATYDDSDVMVYETGRSPVLGPITVTGSTSYGGSYSTDGQINYIRIFSTLNQGTVFYLEKRIANDTDGGQFWTTLNMADTTLDDQTTAYWTNIGYENKRLYTDGVLPPLRCVIQAAGRLWGVGRMHRKGTNEHATQYWSEVAPNWRDWPVRNASTIFAETLTGQYEENELVYVFTPTARWRVTPATYSEGMEWDKLEGGVGCVNHHTIVKVAGAVAWLAEDGFYLTQGDEQPILISGAIEETVRTIRMDRAYFFVGRHQRNLKELQWWVTTGTGRLNDGAICYDYSRGLTQGKWFWRGGLGRTAMSLGEGLMPDGKRVYFLGDHLGNVWQEDVGVSDGMGVGGTYQGTLGYGTTTTSTTSTSTTSTSTTSTTTT